MCTFSLISAFAGLHYGICAEGMENVPLCAADDSHHREDHPDSQAKVHIEYHHREPSYKPNHLHTNRDTIMHCLVRI